MRIKLLFHVDISYVLERQQRYHPKERKNGKTMTTTATEVKIPLETTSLDSREGSNQSDSKECSSQKKMQRTAPLRITDEQKKAMADYGTCIYDCSLNSLLSA
jgi:hypothetical protein